jgi:hypothetical protein
MMHGTVHIRYQYFSGFGFVGMEHLKISPLKHKLE